jgi:hypothetical protein
LSEDLSRIMSDGGIDDATRLSEVTDGMRAEAETDCEGERARVHLPPLRL